MEMLNLNTIYVFVAASMMPVVFSITHVHIIHMINKHNECNRCSKEEDVSKRKPE